MSVDQGTEIEIPRSDYSVGDPRLFHAVSDAANIDESIAQISNAPATLPIIDYSGFEDHPDLAFTSTAGSETDTASYSSKRTQRSRQLAAKYGQRRAFLANWRLEIAAGVASITALVALCITLFCYRNQPSPNWPTWLSLNSIVAIYTVILKTGILLIVAEGLGQLKWSWFMQQRPLHDLVEYDDATRGPAGALSLLWRLKAQNVVASCGALITVLALAVDPLAQQVIHYYDCSVPVPGQSIAIPRTNFFEDTTAPGASLGTVSLRVQRALRTGIFGSAAIGDIGCDTGNCKSTGEYSTTAWCSKCEDISDSVAIGCPRNNFSGGYLGPCRSGLYTSIPNGISIGVREIADQSTFAAMAPSPDASEYHMSFDFLKIKQLGEPIDFETLLPYPVCQTELGKTLWKCRGYGAARCQIFPCVKSYTSSVHAGTFTESLISTASNWNQLGTLNSILDTRCINKRERQYLESVGYEIERSEQWIGYMLDSDLGSVEHWSAGPSVELSMLKRGCLYLADPIFTYNLGEYLTSTGPTSTGSYMQSPFAGRVMGGLLFSMEPAGVFWGSEVVQAFFDSNKVEFDFVRAKFQNISDSLTVFLRENGMTNYSESASGPVYRATTCIDVRWRWLAYPTNLVLLALGFFLLATGAIQPTKVWPEVWKSSPLALLYHGLIPSVESGPETETGSIHAMEEAAKETFVRLQKGEDAIAHFEIMRKGG